MNRVFIIHEPARWYNGHMVPFDLSPADAYGERCVIFPGGDRPPPWAIAGPAMQAALATFTEHDFLLVAGDMDMVVWASVLALRATGGKLRLLKWSNRSRGYEPVDAPDDIWT